VIHKERLNPANLRNKLVFRSNFVVNLVKGVAELLERDTKQIWLHIGNFGDGPQRLFYDLQATTMVVLGSFHLRPHLGRNMSGIEGMREGIPWIHGSRTPRGILPELEPEIVKPPTHGCL
jgi:hypothetical protein